MTGITQVQVQPQRGLTYPVVLRSLLRQDPQVLMIGEIRDAETAHIVIEAALTGHLLLTTIHSGTPAEAIVRLREIGVPGYQLTSTLRGILAQRLLRTSAPPGSASEGGEYAGRTACGHFVELTPALRQAILDEADTATLFRTGGLPRLAPRGRPAPAPSRSHDGRRSAPGARYARRLTVDDMPAAKRVCHPTPASGHMAEI